MANSFLYRMPSGIAGQITRVDETNVETAYMGATAVGAFGAPVKITAGKILPFAGNETAADFYGILTRVAPSQGGSLAQSFTDNVPNPLSLQGVAVRGYINVICAVGTPVKEAPAYIRVVADTGKAIGDFEATSDVTATGVAGTNTGNGTIGTLSSTQSAQSGDYKVTFTAATVFNVVAPSGDLLKSGATGTAYTADGVTFTITAGLTAFIAGDTFTVTVAKNNVLLTNSVWAAGGKDANGNAEIRIAR